MRYIIPFLFSVIPLLLSCEKDEKDENDYPELRGDHIYTSNSEPTRAESPISTIHWISDDEIAVIEGHTIKIIDIQSHNIENNFSTGGDIEYSVLSDNSNFIYYSVSISWENSILYRLNLALGLIETLLNYNPGGDANMLYSGLCVSSDDTKIAYKKSNANNGSSLNTIYLYEIANGNEIELIEGHPILFIHDNSELLYVINSPFSIYSYNFESGESKVVLSDEGINFNSSDFYPSSFINAVKGNGNIFLTAAGAEGDFLIYNLTEAKPIFLGAMEPYSIWKDDNITSGGYQYYGCNFAIDHRKMNLYSWAFDCVEKIWEGWSYHCSPYRYNLSCTDLITKEKTRKGNVLNMYVGTTTISPDGTKLAYLFGMDHKTYSTPQYIHVYIYNIFD